MLLKKFSVKNFKNFDREYTLDFTNVKEYNFNDNCIKDNILKNILIYGRNAVGKTNIGMALFDITYHLVDKKKNNKLYVNYLNADSDEETASFCYEFALEDRIAVYRYLKDAQSQLVKEALFIDEKLVFSMDFIKGEGDFDNLKVFGLDTLNWEFRDNGISVLRYMANNLSLPKEHPIMKIMHFVNGMLWFSSKQGAETYIGFSSKAELVMDYIIRHDLVEDFEGFIRKYGVDEKIQATKNPDGTVSLYFKHKRLIPFCLASNGIIALTLPEATQRELRQGHNLEKLYMSGEFDG